MSRKQQNKKYNKYNRNTENHGPMIDNNNETCRFNGYQKHLIETPNLGSDNIESHNIDEMNEASYSNADGKYVSVDRLRLENINNMLQYLNREFQELSKSNQNENRPLTEVRSGYYDKHNQETLRQIEKLNQK